MGEHLIRLRGGWQRIEKGDDRAASAPGSDRWITLPTTWQEPAGSGAAVRLVRSFAAPPLEAGRERLSLRLSAIAGLVSVEINGQELARPSPGTTALEVPLRGPMPGRNQLVLVVRIDQAAAAGTARSEAPWGVIALVVSDAEHPES
jgi:hypothetical protein